MRSPADVRVIAATNRDLEVEIAGWFDSAVTSFIGLNVFPVAGSAAARQKARYSFAS